MSRQRGVQCSAFGSKKGRHDVVRSDSNDNPDEGREVKRKLPWTFHKLGPVHVLLIASIVLPDYTKAATPTFAVEPTDKTVREGGEIKFSCAATGTPTPKVIGYAKDGVAVRLDTAQYFLESGGTLRIVSATRSMDGYYQCIAGNSEGSLLSKRAKLTVAYFDRVSKITEQKTVNPNSYIILSGPNVLAKPNPKYVWRKDGVVVSESDRISIGTDGSLYIANVERGDAGVYVLSVIVSVLTAVGDTNGNQEVKSVTLKVSDFPQSSIPTIMFGPQNTKALQGSTSRALFECFVSGIKDPTSLKASVLWKKDGQTLSRSAKYDISPYGKRLSVLSPARQDEGFYKCEVNFNGQTSSQSRLEVIVSPTFTGIQKDIIAYTDNSTTLYCNYTAYPGATPKWYLNGHQVIPNSRVKITSIKSLHIERLKWSDGGVYQCLVDNQAGQLIGSNLVKIQNITAKIIRRPTDVFVPIGTTIILPCDVQGAPAPKVTWLKNKLPIPEDLPQFTQRANGYLQITNARSQESGSYTCVAQNFVGKDEATVTVNFLSETVIIKKPDPVTRVVKGLNIELPCEVKHDPKTEIKREWRKNGELAVDVRYTVLSSGALQIRSAQKVDSATYKCLIFSKAGNATATTKLEFVERPFQPFTPRVTEIQARSLRLTWHAGYDGGSPIVYYIIEYKNSTQDWSVRSTTKAATPTTVVISNLMPGRKYTFRLKAKNNFSTSPPSNPSEEVQTLMLAPAQAPGNFKATGISTNSLKLSWTIPPPHTHNGELLGYIIFYRLEGYENSEFTKITVKGGTLTSYVMGSLPEFTRYAVKIAAYNAAGTGKESNTLRAETKEGIPEAAPDNLTVSVVNSSSVRVGFDSPPQRLWNGFLRHIKGYAWKPNRPQDQTTYMTTYDSSSPVRQSFIFLGLKPNTEYALSVSVLTNSGESPKSGIVLFKTQEGVPEAPQDLIISGIYSDAFTVSWKPPSQIAGRLLGYKVRYHLFGDSAFFNITEPPHSKGAVVRGLRPLTRYEVFVQAFTIAGNSKSVSRTVTTIEKPTLPGPPTGLKHYEIKPRSISLGWTPGNSGRAVILYYLIEYNNDTNFKTARDPLWLLALNLTRILDNPVSIPNLRPNSVYRFRMKAFNSVGSSPYSNKSEDIRTAEGAPTEPARFLTARPQGRQTLLIEWVPPPLESWNSDSIRYDISLEPLERPFGVTTRIRYPDSSARSYLARGLDRWMLYNITVVVFNSKGLGPSSESIQARTSEDVPDQGPTNVAAKALDTKRVNVSWGEIPSGLANGIILGYRVVYQLQGKPKTAMNKTFPGNNTHSGILLGLDGFAFYEISVLGYTRTGDGKKSRPVVVKTIEGVPGKPQRVRFPVVTLYMVQVTWRAPLRPNGVILSYDVRYKKDGSAGSWRTVYQSRTGPNVLSAEVNGLTGNTYYRFSIRAKSRIGYGESTEEIVLTTEKRVVPVSPIIEPIPHSAISARHVIVKWVKRSDGQSPIRAFTLQINPELEGWKDYKVDLPANIFTLKVEGLHPVRSYQFRVKATNDVGDSPWSIPSYSVTTTADIPTGAPTEVLIVGDTPTSLSVKWKAPSLEDLNGNLVNFRIKYKKQGTAGEHTTRLLSPQDSSYRVTGLETFTAYEIALAAINEKGTGPWTPLYVRRTGESRPTQAPTGVQAIVESSNSIRLKWNPPPANTINGYLRGYKIEYVRLGDASKRRRKRRSVSGSCAPLGSPLEIKLVPPNTAEEVLGNLRRFTEYRISIRAYNSAGDGPRSVEVKRSTTEDVPGPPQVTFTRSYTDLVEIHWNPPCEPNGVIREYQLLYLQTGGQRFPIKKFPASQRLVRVYGLQSLLQYKFTLSAATSVGYGKGYLFSTYTRGAARLPGPPGTPHIVIRNNGFIIDWKEGEDGNVPITSYVIEGRNSVSEGWREMKTISPSSATRNNTVLSYTLTQLKPETTYMFRLIAVNRIGSSPPSPSSVALKAGGRVGSKPIYKEIWFIVMLICIALVLITFIIVVICLRRKSRQGKYGSPNPVLHLETHWVQKGPWVDNASEMYEKPVAHRVETPIRFGNKVEHAENRQGYGFSSFEMAMVRRQGSGQRLIREESNQGNGTLSSQGTKKSKTLDRVVSPKSDAKVSLDNVSVSSVSKHSDISENDADKSADETEEERRYRRNHEMEASIASHYSNDPFHKSWRNSMDKKTRKAILAEYNKKREAQGSVDTLDQKRPHRSASEERLDRPRGRPGRPDQSEKKKRTRSEPFLAEPEDDAGISSFAPGKATGQPEIRRPGKKGIDRTVARSDPYLAREPSDSDSDQRFPGPPSYDSSTVPGRPTRRKNSFLKATHGNEPDTSESTSATPQKSKREMAEELDRALDYYQRPPPPYESDVNGYESDTRPPPAYTPTFRDRPRQSDWNSPYSGEPDFSDDPRYSSDSRHRNGQLDDTRSGSDSRYDDRQRRSTTDAPSSDEVDGRTRNSRPYKPKRSQNERRSDYNDFAEPRTVPNRHSDHFEDPNRSMTLV